MLTLLGKSSRNGRFCDGMSRRSFLTAGGMAYGGLSLASLLQAESAQGIGSSHKGLINIFLPGGPPHQDMWDLKPDAPAEVRGEFKPISTNVPGVQIGELFPKLAAMMDKLAIVRSIVGAKGPHYARQCMSPQITSHAPSLGAWVSRLEGPCNQAIPPHLSLFYRTSHAPWGQAGDGGFFGGAYAPFELLSKYAPGHTAESTAQLAPDPGHLVVRTAGLKDLGDRRSLLTQLDGWHRGIDGSPALSDRDYFTKQAWGILASPN